MQVMCDGLVVVRPISSPPKATCVRMPSNVVNRSVLWDYFSMWGAFRANHQGMETLLSRLVTTLPTYDLRIEIDSTIQLELKQISDLLISINRPTNSLSSNTAKTDYHDSENLIYGLEYNQTDDRVKHMKVYERTMEGVPHYFLSESRFFRSITDLIGCYEHSSLGENFVGLDVTLKWPFRRIIAIAEFDFNPSESNQLPLRKGCQVIVLSKEGDYKGWWKGKVQDRVGFFPKDYVREVSETD
uniref:SH3 domain-containing protein n=1 Tax=Timema genevievae TaxID=629358 RepID=A0A7R9K193_TIMGE|nr:unnamed protein product [Timema genevievae]